MTEGTFTPPPPPLPPAAPPAAPPPPPGAPAFDFVKPLTFVFEDPRWVTKVLVGGLFFLLSFILIGTFFLMGYVARLVRNVIAGVQYPLPEWDDLGTYFSEGIKLFLVALAYILPLIVIAILVGIPAAIMTDADNEGLRNIGGCLLGSVWCLVLPLGLGVTFFLPAATLMAVVHNRMGAAFEFRKIWAFIKANIGNYLLALVVYLVARFAAGFGFILLCIGIIFTEFWALVATGYAFAQVYRMSARR